MEINALTLRVAEMARSLAFYEGALGLAVCFGGGDAEFTSLRFGDNYVNLFVGPDPPGFWGRAVLHVDSPDEVWQRLVDAGYEPEFAPRDAPWGERYFHVRDPDGHELSFARPL